MGKCRIRRFPCNFIFIPLYCSYKRHQKAARRNYLTSGRKGRKIMKKAERLKKILRVAGIAVMLLFILGAAGVSVLNNQVGKQVAEGLLYQNNGNDTRKNSVLQLEKWGYDLEGFEERYQPRMCSVTAGDGVISPAAVFVCPESGNTAILVHGAGGDHVSMYPVAEMYLKNNWNVIAIDQRACGASEDDKVSFGYFEKQDVAAWVDYAESEMASVKIVVHGQSMGAASAALYASDGQYERKADAVILDSCIDSMERMFLGVWREMDGTEGIPEDYVVSCGGRYLKKHFGFGFEDADVLEKMKENHVKTLMIQCRRDEIVPNQIAEQIFQNIPAENKEICYFDSRHVEAAVDYPVEYEKAVFAFLNED